VFFFTSDTSSCEEVSPNHTVTDHSKKEKKKKKKKYLVDAEGIDDAVKDHLIVADDLHEVLSVCSESVSDYCKYSYK
jgi:hypothetical protein